MKSMSALALDPAPADVRLPLSCRFQYPKMPIVMPVLGLDEETAITIWAILHASGGTITRMDLARSFALRSQPVILKKLAAPALWKSFRHGLTRSALEPLLGRSARVLRSLAGRDGVELTIGGVVGFR